MSTLSSPGADNPLSTTDPEFVRMQLEQAYETFRGQLTLATQAFAVLTTVNVTMIGFAVAYQLASVLLAAALFPVAMLFVAYVTVRVSVPVLYTSVSLEQLYGAAGTDLLGSTFVAVVGSVGYLDELRKASSLPDAAERVARLHQIRTPWMRDRKGFYRLALILLAVGQAVAAIALAVFFDWRLL